jgi:hypothetical protein
VRLEPGLYLCGGPPRRRRDHRDNASINGAVLDDLHSGAIP